MSNNEKKETLIGGVAFVAFIIILRLVFGRSDAATPTTANSTNSSSAQSNQAAADAHKTELLRMQLMQRNSMNAQSQSQSIMNDVNRTQQSIINNQNYNRTIGDADRALAKSK